MKIAADKQTGDNNGTFPESSEPHSEWQAIDLSLRTIGDGRELDLNQHLLQRSTQRTLLLKSRNVNIGQYALGAERIIN